MLLLYAFIINSAYYIFKASFIYHFKLYIPSPKGGIKVHFVLFLTYLDKLGDNENEQNYNYVHSN